MRASIGARLTHAAPRRSSPYSSSVGAGSWRTRCCRPTTRRQMSMSSAGSRIQSIRGSHSVGGAVERRDEQQAELPGSCECVVALELFGPVHELDGHRARGDERVGRGGDGGLHRRFLQPGVLPGSRAFSRRRGGAVVRARGRVASPGTGGGR